MLGLSSQEICLRIRDGIYPAMKDRRGWYWMSRDVVETFMPDERRKLLELERARVAEVVKKVQQMPKKKEPPAEVKPSYSGEDASRVFAELEKGTTPSKIVIALKIRPDVVQEIAQSWFAMEQCVLLRPHTVREIEKLPLRGTFPILSGEQLLAMLQDAFGVGNAAAEKEMVEAVAKALANKTKAA